MADSRTAVTQQPRDNAVLVVDDTPSVIDMVKTALEGEGYRVLAATTGQKALKIAGATRPDLILLDVMMPGMNGYETCLKLKECGDLIDIPVVFMSALTQAFDKVQAFNAGAVDYIVKPIAAEELAARVRTHVSLSRLRKALAAANATLEEKVLARTEALRGANARLEAEIVERRRSEERLRESEAKFRNLFESAPDGIVITTLAGKFLAYNTAAGNMFGFDDPETARMTRSADLYEHPADREHMLELLKRRGNLESYRLSLKDARGRKFPASLSLRLIRYDGETCLLSVLRDISRIRKMEAELKNYAENLEQMVSEKTAALEQANAELADAVRSLEETRAQLAQSAHQAGMAEIAASILHNIGNAVNSVNVRVCDLARADFSEQMRTLEKIRDALTPEGIGTGATPEGADKLEKIRALMTAAVEIIRKRSDRFRTDAAFIEGGLGHVMEIIALQQRYAGLRGFETRENVNDLLRDAAGMLTDSIGKRGVDLTFELAEVPPLLMDKNRMIQIFINLVKNAYEAIDMAVDAGFRDIAPRIWISAARRREDGGDVVRIIIADSGIGASDAEKERLFRFNYSTKRRKTGFGLHDAANYITSLGGRIRLESAGVGKGAAVIIELPAERDPTG